VERACFSRGVPWRFRSRRNGHSTKGAGRMKMAVLLLPLMFSATPAKQVEFDTCYYSKFQSKPYEPVEPGWKMTKQFRKYA
jgi:hypothetical protein